MPAEEAKVYRSRLVRGYRVRKICIFRLKNQETNKSKTKNVESKDTTTKLKKYSLQNSSRFKLFFLNKM